MRTRAQALVLLTVGLVVIRVASGAALTGFVRPGTRPLVLCAGAVVALAGAGGLRGTGSRGTWTAWLALAPVMVLGVVRPPALGVLSAQRPPVTPPRPGAGFHALPPTGTVTLPLSEVVLRTVWGAGATLAGRSLRVTGFVVRAEQHGFVLARLVITCCAADAEPYDLDVRAIGPAPTPGTWVTVTGTWTGRRPGAVPVPVLRARSTAVVAAPSNPYG